MKKIKLFCAQGMSTSMLVRKMAEAINEKQLDYTVEAHALNEVEALGPDADFVLIGPQIRFQLERVQKACTCPCEVIDSRSYGMMDGKGIVAHIQSIIGD